MMHNNTLNKMMQSLELINKAKDSLLKAQKASIATAKQMIASLPEGTNKQMLTNEFKNLQNASKEMNAKEVQQINDRLLEMIKKLNNAS